MYGAGVCYQSVATGNESVLTQLAQCWFPGLAISNAKISNIFFKQNTQKQFYQIAPGNRYG